MVLFSKKEREYLENPELFNSNYEKVLRHRLRKKVVKINQYTEEINLYQKNLNRLFRRKRL